MLSCRLAAVMVLLSLVAAVGPVAADEVIPHNQDRPPNDPLSPEQAVARMTVPEGFRVEIVAAEPDLVNPVAMTFDERGRVWVAESLEYPRLEAGEGRDRIKVLEDTDGDGRMDQVGIFAEGFNIPSGLAVGYGGVWVANSPDILFLQDTDGDGRADRREVVATGFGRRDTHELPNSLTWGPDGWLYGLNGVFNPSVVRTGERELAFTCAMFRIHPRTREFQLFAEGTSNPWGIAFDELGSAFVSACVIDHLWHIVERGYYHRQAGAYPPFCWPLGSIVDYQHQKAAYCGIHYFDSDAYPSEYRQRLYMGNIHGGCINVDAIARAGASYRGTACPDFLTANDAWFMPVAQKTGPDGCLYVLDWYDRYHCYQDARRDAEGIDRGRGRLYRVRYRDTPRAAPFDLLAETDEQLIGRLSSPNIFYRDLAQRILGERAGGETDAALERHALAGDVPLKCRLHALFARLARGSLKESFLIALLADRESSVRAWGVRAAGNLGKVSGPVAERLKGLIGDPAADVQLQLAVAAGKLDPLRPVQVLSEVLVRAGDDPTIPSVAWHVLEQVGRDQRDTVELLHRLTADDALQSAAVAAVGPRLLERLLAEEFSPTELAAWLRRLTSAASDHMTIAHLRLLTEKTHNGELDSDYAQTLREAHIKVLGRLAGSETAEAVRHEALILAASWLLPEALVTVKALALDEQRPDDERLRALAALVAADDPEVVATAIEMLQSSAFGKLTAARGVLSLLGRVDRPEVAVEVLALYGALPPTVQPVAIGLLAERGEWARLLLSEMAAGRLRPMVLNANQARRIQALQDAELSDLLARHWGTVRQDRDPAREQVLTRMRALMDNTPGEAERGVAIFRRLCSQCHQFRGEGIEVGPDLTNNGRDSLEQLLSNVFDPSLVIGTAYQARTVLTTDGRALVGLVVEEGPERIVLKVQGGKLEVIPRDDVDEMELSNLSLMPEGIENQASEQELVDLFVYLLKAEGAGSP